MGEGQHGEGRRSDYKRPRSRTSFQCRRAFYFSTRAYTIFIGICSFSITFLKNHAQKSPPLLNGRGFCFQYMPTIGTALLRTQKKASTILLEFVLLQKKVTTRKETQIRLENATHYYKLGIVNCITQYIFYFCAYKASI